MSERYFSSYFYYSFLYLYEKDVFYQYENGTTGIKNLAYKIFAENHDFVIADRKLLRVFEEQCHTLRVAMVANSAENETLSALRDTLLPKLISGELPIKNAEKFLEKAGV